VTNARDGTIAYHDAMTTIVGADGCPQAWLCIFEELPSRQLRSEIFPTVHELFAAAAEIELLAIDIPIGLTDAHARECDRAARVRLGPVRGTSVFPAPIRPALDATSYPEACEASFAAQQKKISKQAWMIYPKIRELDGLLRTRGDLRERIFEIHPEVTFSEWNGAPIVEPKRKRSGRGVRRELVRRHFGDGAFDAVRTSHSREKAADDDILDAFAALWTAERIHRGEARSLPEYPRIDSAGLPMRMMY
jgi:predicted RNase H-like nuclease